jgi:signal transduction histidine kinase/DNA-binding NarL/FixJ family response regulator
MPKLRQHTKSLLLVSSLLSVALVVIIAINAQVSMREMSRNNAELYNAYRISELMKTFRTTFNVLENKRKGYIITGDAKFKEASREKESELKTLLKSMEHYLAGSAEEDLYNHLKDLSYQRIAENKTPGAGSNLAGFQTNAVDDESQLNTVDEIRTVLDEINEHLDQHTRVLIDNSIAYVTETRNWSVAEVSITVALAIIALIIVFRDINTRTRLEAELRKAKQKSDENAQIKEQFMANMSHEIRTPLNAIIGFSHLLEKTPLQPQQKEQLQAIQSSSVNLLNIVNDILDFSKLEAGQLNIEKVSFHLPQVFADLQRMFSAKAVEKNIQFKLLKENGVPDYLFGDPNRLSQILINLINNAIKFTEQGTVTLTCELKHLEHDIATLVFRVRDTGIGIAADKLEGVFERFKQASSDTTRKYGGTGLGLSIVKDLVERQNGSITLKSKLGQGSEFSVQIAYPISADQKILVPESADALTKFKKNKCKVLLAEDNLLNQKLASTYLEAFGISVDLVSDGVEAIEKCRSNTYDLILMDIHMPHKDGYQATEDIRHELACQTPIVAMTANSLEGEKEKCLSKGMNDYLAKPFKETDLHEVLIKWLPQDAQEGRLDLKNFYSLTMGNKQFMREMIELFMDRNPIDLQMLKDAAAKSHYDALRETAHKMKTSVGFMGITELLEPLNTIELLSEKEEGISTINELVSIICSTCDAAQNELKNELYKINAA